MTNGQDCTPNGQTMPSDNITVLKLVAAADRAPTEIDQDLHIPLASRAAFWQPRHLALSDTLVHVPFLFWLVETCRPESIIQIGTGDGIGFLALCQAVDKLSLSAPCIGVNPVSDTPSLPEPLAEQHRTYYDEFSFIIQEDPSSALREGGIDLLVLHAELTDDLIMALRAHWQARLSERAVVAVCNPGRIAQGQSAREYLDSLGAACPSVRFQHAEGDIEVYLVGKDQPERLQKLAGLGIGTPAYMAARQVFARLGQGLHQSQRARVGEAALRQAEAAADDARARLNTREEELQALRKEIARTQDSESEQAAIAADLQARLFDAERARIKAERDARASRAVEKLQAELAEAQDMRKALEAKNADLEARNSALKKLIDERIAEIASITKVSEKRH